jgi:GrpB-like predicted nucleotidyltransferase (UPF0157 family)
MLEERLRRRLSDVGLDPDSFGDPGAAWEKLHQRFGQRITLVERYALEAESHGVSIDELPLELRDRLGRELLTVQFPGFELVGGSEREVRDPVEVVDYDPRWPVAFTEWHDRLAGALAHLTPRIEHVGSTAVAGLAAKPVIDVQVSLHDLDDEAAYVPQIEALGIALRSREPVRRYFRPAGSGNRVVQVHVCSSGSAWERDHLLFRDYLRAHDVARDSYAQLKRGLADRFTDDRLAYTDAKTDFILDALEEAQHWAAATGWAP